MMKRLSESCRFCAVAKATTAFALTLLFLLVPLHALAQSAAHSSAESETEVAVENPAALRYADPVTVIWEFGIEATAGGDTRGILATAPVPIEWPEQTVEIIGEEKTDNVNRISYKALTREAQQMVVKINRLPAGETARAVVLVKITRQRTIAPADPAQLRIPERPDSQLKPFLRPSPMIECKDARIEEIAESIGTDSSLNDWQKVEAVYDWVRENIEYRFANENYSCLEALEMGHGDCGELTALFVAICRAKGIPARSVWIPGHAYPEFYLEDAAGNGFWIPCQAAGEREFGAMTESKPVLQKGDNFNVPGISEAVRFIQPTLVAKDAAGGVSLVHIADEVRTVENETEVNPRNRSLLDNNGRPQESVPENSAPQNSVPENSLRENSETENGAASPDKSGGR